MAVSGLMIRLAACSNGSGPDFKGMHRSASATKYSAQVPSQSARGGKETRLPNSQRASSPPPVAITVPAPSQPGTVGSDLSVPYLP